MPIPFPFPSPSLPFTLKILGLTGEVPILKSFFYANMDSDFLDGFVCWMLLGRREGDGHIARFDVIELAIWKVTLGASNVLCNT